MKRISALLIAISLMGCAGTKTDQVASTVQTEITPVIETAPSATAETAPEVKKDGFDVSATIEEQILYESDGIVLKATGLTYEDSRAKLMLNAENSGSHDVEILSGTMGLSCNAVNSWMIHDGWMNMKIPSGKKANETVFFDFEPMQAYGIAGIETLYMTFQIESDGKYSDRIVTEPIAVHTSLASNQDKVIPFEEMVTAAANLYDSGRKLQYCDNSELYNASGVRVTDTAYLTSDDGDKILVLGLINESDQVLDIDSSDIAANGFSICSGRWSSETIIPGKRSFMMLELSSMKNKEDWELMGITDVSDITLSLGVRNLNYEYLSKPQPISVHVSDVSEKEENKQNDNSRELYSANGVRIVSKGFVEDNLYVEWKLLIENTNEYEIEVSDGWGKNLSINDYMIDYVMFAEYVGAKQSSIAEIDIFRRSLEDSGIDPANLGKVEMELEINDDKYNVIDTPKIVLDMSSTDS